MPEEEKNVKPFYKQPDWYLEKFSPALIVVIAATISTYASGEFDKAWVYAIIGYFVAVAAIIVTTVIVNNHFNNKHAKPECCTKAINETCSNIDNLHCKYSQRCEEAIKQMNEKLKEQSSYADEFNTFVTNAQQLGKMFTAAVGQRLRTNKQVAEIEANAIVGSEILIMTAYFNLEIFNEDMKSSIVKNINRGVKYRYIIPYEKKKDFKKMVHTIFAHPDLNPNFKKSNENNFLTASCAKKEFFMLTIAYYEIKDTPLANAPSAVIVKLPAENKSEAIDEDAMIYLVPEGQNNTGDTANKNGQTQKINPEHTIFKESLNAIYQMGIDKNNPELAYTANDLLREFPYGIDGVKIELEQ